ncbi:efflux transporter outer membrane subunit [Xylophilus sp.]|uniref:efflux transporter outer membrane subunit n=1 Tax=Xylophilus sp. TaxID=2653893 RepID=UPI0013B5C61E|nr:efflux transporter outer membrane subunit [Xylophilus sp.]KAF1043046.1 MAG: Outer membrane protein OprM [Xylophilus sp.]
MNHAARLLPLVVALSLAGCAGIGPAYHRPDAPPAAAWKEQSAAAGWVPATPGDTLDRGPWWSRFGDPALDALAQRVQVSNQNIAAAVANYAQAEALVRQQRAALLPSLSASGSGRRSGGVGSDGTPASGAYSATLGASWTPDLWGRLRNTVDSAQASAQASQADLASARLAAIGSLATDYFSLREADAEIALLTQAIEGYERSLAITQNRYNAGIAAQTDVLQARSQLLSTQADRVGVQRTRDTLEHAIAVLVGEAPAGFRLPAAPWVASVPSVPLALPSLLLQRRPDIASAERSVAEANAQIGIARAAYFPTIDLTASIGGSSSRVGDLFSASSLLWALGVSVAQTVFDGGAIDASVDAARAAHTAQVASYRQTVLSAFQAVEDQLSAVAALAAQEGLRREDSEVADRTEQQQLNRYRAAQISYTDVVTAQVAALTARRSLAQVQLARQTAAIALIQALGGGWEADWLANPP